MMEELFLSVLNMSMTASYVILFIMLIRFPLKKAPKIISYALWSVSAIRLLCPFSFESMFSLLPRNTSPIPLDITYQSNPQINSGIESIDTIVNGALPAPVVEASVNPLQLYTQIGAYIWIAGIAAILIYSIVSVMILKRQLISAKPVEKNIYEADNLKTPFVLGFLRPKIYIPAGLSAEERCYILLHEQMHIHRHDHIVKTFAFFVLSVHWFNPLVWVAFMLMSTDMELSCDERVIREMGGEIKKPYAASLLSLATGGRILNASPLAFGEGNVKGRIKNVLNYKRSAFWVVTVAVIATVFVAICLLVNPRETINLPTADVIQSITIEQVNAGASIGPVTVTDHDDFETILSSLSEAKKTNRQPSDSISNDESYDNQNYFMITLTLLDGEKTLYLYAIGGRYYIEEPFDGVYRINRNTSVAIAQVYTKTETGGVDPPTDEPLIFSSGETDLIKLGTTAFDTYMSFHMSEQTPVSERIASYKLNDISILAGDINEFCVSLNYDFTTDNENYVNPARGAKGKGTWPDNYLELRVQHAYEDVYSIKGIGTGGGGQGLAPYAQQQTTLEPIAPRWSHDQTLGVDMASLDYASDDIVIFHGYFGLFVYDLNSLQIIRSLDLKSLKCDATQGDNYCEVSVSIDGNTVQLHPMSSENMYIYTVSDNTLRETAYERMSDRFGSNFVPIEDVIDLEKLGLLYSYHAVKFSTGEYGYLRASNNWTLGTLSYVRGDIIYKLFDIKEN